MSKYNFNKDELKKSINNSHEILSLPMYPELDVWEIKYICDKVNEFFLVNNLIKVKVIKTDNKPGTLNCINNIQFDTKRCFYIKDIDKEGKRGLHANLNFDEVLIIIKGKINLKIINKQLVEESIELNAEDIYFIPKLHWIEFEFLDKNSILLCLTNIDTLKLAPHIVNTTFQTTSDWWKVDILFIKSSDKEDRIISIYLKKYNCINTYNHNIIIKV